MALIIEDGTGVANADSYITVAEAQAILVPLGQTLSTTVETAEQQLRNATYYLEAYRDVFKGQKVALANPLQWPRSGVSIDNFAIDSDTIPDELKRSQAYAAWEIQNGGNLQQTTTGESVRLKEVTGAVKKEFFDTGPGANAKVYTRVNQQLAPLLNNTGGIRPQRG